MEPQRDLSNPIVVQAKLGPLLLNVLVLLSVVFSLCTIAVLVVVCLQEDPVNYFDHIWRPGTLTILIYELVLCVFGVYVVYTLLVSSPCGPTWLCRVQLWMGIIAFIQMVLFTRRLFATFNKLDIWENGKVIVFCVFQLLIVCNSVPTCLLVTQAESMDDGDSNCILSNVNDFDVNQTLFLILTPVQAIVSYCIHCLLGLSLKHILWDVGDTD